MADKTINRVLTWLYWTPSDSIRIGYIYRQLKKAGYKLDDKETDREFNKLGQAMLKMNYDAVNSRYDEKTETTEFKMKDEKARLTQVLKSLQCFLYQCAEGSIPKRKLYKAFKDIEVSIMSEIIETQTDYEKMEWD